MPNLTLLDGDEEEHDTKLCQICVCQPGKYTCPRCNIGYCSLPCYQAEAHGACSEAFYRECVLEDVKCRPDDPDAERTMMEILRRLQQSDVEADELDSGDVEANELDSDDECEVDLSDRLASVDLDDADSVWEKLTETERREFEDLVRDGDVTKLLPSWRPWWKQKEEKKMVEEVDTQGQDLKTKDCPPVKTNIPVLSQVTSTPPAAAVKHNAANVIAAYCHVCRWFHGDHHQFTSEAVQALVSLSGNLGSGHNYDSFDVALEAAAQAAINCSWLGGSAETSLTMRSDVADILADVVYLQSALSDVHALLSAAKKARPTPAKDAGKFSRRYGDNAAPTLAKEKVRLCVKKVEYYLAWAGEHASDICGRG